MGTNMVAIKERVRELLRDNPSGASHEWGDGELDAHIRRTLVEVSEASPYETLVTSLTISSGKEVDITSIADSLIFVDKAEYPIDKSPPYYRSVEKWGNILRVITELLPTDGADVYLYCAMLHTLDNNSSTMSKLEEDCLVVGGVAYAAQAWLNIMRTELKAAIALLTSSSTALTSMTAILAQVTTDMASARTKIGSVGVGDPIKEYLNLSAHGVQSSNGNLSQSAGWLREMATQLSEPRIATTYQGWVNLQIGEYRDRLNRITKNRTSREYPTA